MIQVQCTCAYPRNANLFDDILTFVLFGFYKNCFSKGTFSNFLHIFVLIHVFRGSRCSCCVYTDLCSILVIHLVGILVTNLNKDLRCFKVTVIVVCLIRWNKNMTDVYIL